MRADESLKTTISSVVIKRLLMKGLFFAMIGIIGITLSGAFFSVPLLKNSGLLIYLGGMGLIIWGLLPYKKMLQLQLKPNEIRLYQNGEMQFFSKGKKIITIHVNSIQQIKYYENKINYGVLIWFTQSVTERVVIHDGAKNEVDFMRKQGCATADADIFIPWFKEKSVNKITAWWKN